jgi:hypothetical protein
LDQFTRHFEEVGAEGSSMQGWDLCFTSWLGCTTFGTRNDTEDLPEERVSIKYVAEINVCT